MQVIHLPHHLVCLFPFSRNNVHVPQGHSSTSFPVALPLTVYVLDRFNFPKCITSTLHGVCLIPALYVRLAFPFCLTGPSSRNMQALNSFISLSKATHLSDALYLQTAYPQSTFESFSLMPLKLGFPQFKAQSSLFP